MPQTICHPLRVRVKICGVTTPEMAITCAEAGADAIGLVFAEHSKRSVTPTQAAKIIDALPAFVEPVGLFVDNSWQFIRETASVLGLRTVQLHGREGPAHASQLNPLRVIKAIGFDPNRLADRVEPWRRTPSPLSAVLIDTPPKPGALTTGGSGQTFDWGQLRQAKEAGAFEGLPPLVLAGGLTPDNVAQAIDAVRPYAVDVSSGVESEPGVKDPDKVRAFCAAIA